MQQLEVAMSPFTRRSRSIAVSHNSQDLTRGLDVGDHVLLHDPVTDTYFSSVVADVTFELEDTCYRVVIGGQITPTEATEWVAPLLNEDRLTTRDIAQLLAELRDGERQISAALAGSPGR